MPCRLSCIQCLEFFFWMCNLMRHALVIREPINVDHELHSGRYRFFRTWVENKCNTEDTVTGIAKFNQKILDITCKVFSNINFTPSPPCQ